MNDIRLNSLTVLNIKCEIIKSIIYYGVVEVFDAQNYHRKIKMYMYIFF
jgi:hypothetical protein